MYVQRSRHAVEHVRFESVVMFREERPTDFRHCRLRLSIEPSEKHLDVENREEFGIGLAGENSRPDRLRSEHGAHFASGDVRQQPRERDDQRRHFSISSGAQSVDHVFVGRQ